VYGNKKKTEVSWQRVKKKHGLSCNSGGSRQREATKAEKKIESIGREGKAKKIISWNKLGKSRLKLDFEAGKRTTEVSKRRGGGRGLRPEVKEAPVLTFQGNDNRRTKGATRIRPGRRKRVAKRKQLMQR